MDPPDSGTEAVKRLRHGRWLVIVAALAFVAVGLFGVASALSGPDKHPVAVTTNGSTATTLPTTTTPQSTTEYVPPSTAPTTPPTTSPPPTSPPTTRPPATIPLVTAAPRTVPTVVAAARLQGNPSTANFPSTPPPYWPMPIVHVTVTNTGGVTVRSVVVHPVGVYSVPSSSCATLAPGQSCDAQVQFCPNSPGHYVNTLTVTGQNAVTGSPMQTTVTLNGTAT